MIEKIIKRYWEANLLSISIVDYNGHSLYHISTWYDLDSDFKLLLNVDNDVSKYKNKFGNAWTNIIFKNTIHCKCITIWVCAANLFLFCKKLWANPVS